MSKSYAIYQAGNAIARGLKSLSDEQREGNATEKNRLEFEKETKNRVDISLKEYEQMKHDLEYWKNKAEVSWNSLKKITKPLFKLVGPNSVVTEELIGKIFDGYFDCKVTAMENYDSAYTSLCVVYKIEKEDRKNQNDISGFFG